MTIEQYYKAVDNLNPPEGLDFPEEKKWFLAEKAKLQKQLSPEDLELVLSRSRDWQKKVASSNS